MDELVLLEHGGVLQPCYFTGLFLDFTVSAGIRPGGVGKGGVLGMAVDPYGIFFRPRRFLLKWFLLLLHPGKLFPCRFLPRFFSGGFTDNHFRNDAQGRPLCRGPFGGGKAFCLFMVFDFNQETASAGDDGVGIDMAARASLGKAIFQQEREMPHPGTGKWENKG
ncbi:hypothetical protein ABGM91_00285 [Akkermansia muciniphila]|uniref:hypothetical protein n=1 Tax=Akkermansia muciniphila TaxID=239935 RepID=UPI0033A0EFB8